MNVRRKFSSVILVSGMLGALGLVGAHAAERAPSYESTIKLGEHEGGERGEAARYVELAKIDVGQAIAAAQARVAGKVVSASLESENGNLVYSVVVKPTGADGSVQDIKVDAGNGTVLHVDTGNGREDRDEEERD
jgi:uncharacterized membrane protein YkoI